MSCALTGVQIAEPRYEDDASKEAGQESERREGHVGPKWHMTVHTSHGWLYSIEAPHYSNHKMPPTSPHVHKRRRILQYMEYSNVGV